MIFGCVIHCQVLSFRFEDFLRCFVFLRFPLIVDCILRTAVATGEVVTFLDTEAERAGGWAYVSNASGQEGIFSHLVFLFSAYFTHCWFGVRLCADQLPATCGQYTPAASFIQRRPASGVGEPGILSGTSRRSRVEGCSRPRDCRSGSNVCSECFTPINVL
jgi:hypothetical protein